MSLLWKGTSLSLAAAVIGCTAGLSQAGSAPEWSRSFNARFGPGAWIYDAVVWDDGSGPALYVAGQFLHSQGDISASIAKFDGENWTPVGSGVIDGFTQGTVRTLAVFDPDGTGSQPSMLVVGGLFTNVDGFNISAINAAAWDGTQWLPMGVNLADGTSGSSTFFYGVNDLAVFDSGSGPKLYATGGFDLPGTGQGIAVWNGTDWQHVGAGTLGGSSPVGRDLKVFDDGTGPALYVGGSFSGGVIKWNGSAWSAVAGMPSIDRMVVFDHDSNGSASPRLVGASHGDLIVVAGGPTTTIPGFSPAGETPALAVFDDGSGPAIYLGPGASNVDPRMYRWDGVAAAMTPVGTEFLGQSDAYPTPAAKMLVEFDDGTGPQLWCGGIFGGAEGAPAEQDVLSHGLMRWDGDRWHTAVPQGGLVHAHNGYSHSHDAVVFDLDGAGSGSPSLVVGGSFDQAGDTSSHGIAAWDGYAWSAFGGGLDAMVAAAGNPSITPVEVRGVVVFNDGSGPALYAAASFSSGGGVIDRFGVFKWSGSSWSPVGTPYLFSSYARDMIVFNDGSGDALYVASSDIKKWNGSSWTTIPSTLTGPFTAIQDLHVLNDGGAAALYASGFFSAINGVSASNIAKWNGTAWSAVGGGISGGTSLAVMGGTLYAAAPALTAPGAPSVDGIAKWNGTAWSGIAHTLPIEWTAGNGWRFLGVHNDGSSDKLYFSVVEYDQSLGVIQYLYSVLWTYDAADGFQRLPETGVVTVGSNATPTRVVSFNDGAGPAMYLLGDIAGVNATSTNGFISADSEFCSSGIARFGPALPDQPSCPADFNGDNARDVADLFAYINAWLAKTANADFNDSGNVDVADLFAYINAWLAGC